ncbi:MAG TPA: hypothetical protein VFG67_06810 [Oleiagrimonas sp.]|nr:hypothetical protein [Oleiagrimonas sp.]
MSRFTIALSGLSDTDAAMFEAALDALPERQWELVDGSEAHLLVVDIDTVWGHMDWLRATANGQQVAAYTKDGNVRHCDVVLTKPLRTRDLGKLLEDLADGKSHPKAPTAAKPAPTQARAKPAPAPAVAKAPAPVVQAETVAATPQVTPAPVPEPAPEPLPPMTLGAALLSDKLTFACNMQGPDGTLVQLDPERGGYTGPSTLKPLKPLLGMSMDKATRMQSDAVEHMREAPALPLTRLLWFAALSATPGTLAPNLDPQGRYHLARWPQIEREFPRHFRIATAMMKGPGTLGDIASLANAPVGDVADFINAYSVAGYVVNDSMPDAVEEAPADGNNRMFSRLRRPFGRNGQQEVS